MAPPRASRNPRPPSRSRFQEGSMNDRTSTVPPVRFIGPDDRMSLEERKRPDVIDTIRPVVSEDVATSAPPPLQQQQQQQQTGTLGKRGSKQFLGQVWGGVMEKLRIKRDPAPEKKQQQRKDMPAPPPPPPPAGDRPSRDDVYANYQQLVNSGFFASHAIQSTRQPGPTRPSTSAGHHPSSPACAAPPQPPPLWPLHQPPARPTRNHPSSPIQSPTSASSRGTKRAVDPNADDDNDDDEDHPKSHKKLRKTASATRNLAIPRVRSSSRLAAARRSVSAANAPQREPNKLTKRVLGLQAPPPPPPARVSSAKRDGGSRTFGLERPRLHGGDGSRSGAAAAAAAAAALVSAGTGDRVLRPRRSAAEPLRVRPDANRGIPSVPDIPAKFTYGEDRENAGPWRGLRRNHANSFYNSTSGGSAIGR